MRQLFRSSFLWQFAGGFVLGAIGLVALEPASANRTLVDHFRPGHAHVAR